MSEEGRFERAIETLLADRSPRRVVRGLSDEHLRMLRMAQRLRGSRSQAPSPELIDRLHARLFPSPARITRRGAGLSQIRITRRGAVLSGLGTLAAGVIAGVGLERAVEPGVSWKRPELVGANGRWFPVATLADLPDGTVLPVSAGAVHGFLVHREGRLYALSSICTDMGCMLGVNRTERMLECPCHGAEFDLEGRLVYGPRKYGRPLPPLPPLRMRVRGDRVDVFGV